MLIVVVPQQIASAPTEISNGSLKAPPTIKLVSKHYSSGYLPVVGGYVEYQLELTNDDSMPIRDQSLWTLFTSKDNVTHAFGSYLIASLDPHQSKTLFLGPFKMREDGMHTLIVGINRKVNSSTTIPTNGILLNHPVGKSFDSFLVYKTSFVQLIIPTSTIIVTAGFGIIIFGIVIHRKKLE